MSPARADVVNAVELAGRAAELDRDLELSQLPRLQEAGALPGTRARARLSFASFEHRPTIEAHVSGVIVTLCQRCMRPCECDVDEQATLMVVPSDAEPVAGGFEPCVADAEHLSVQAVVEEQLLLALPLVPVHADMAECTPDETTDARPAREDRQRPFANLRDLLDKRRT
jgi:uncharacterized protein